MKHLLRKIGEVGLLNCVIGILKKEKYKRLQKKYHFDSWHVSPYELRKYIQATADYINSKKADTVVDIGCGLGEMLRHINAGTRLGLDIQEEVIQAAGMLSAEDDIIYKTGSFSELSMDKPIDYLVTLGFMHGSPESTWKSCYHEISERNDIRHFIVDVLPAREGIYCLDFQLILPEQYQMAERMGPFLSGRYIEVYAKIENM